MKPKFLPVIFSFLFVVFFQSVGAQSIVVKPYIQNVSPTQAYIMWETDDNGQGTVVWGLTPFSLTNTTISTSQNGSGNSRIHTALIPGLTPSTKYYYRVRTASGNTTIVYNFKSSPTKASEESIRLVAMSDMQRDFSNTNVFKDLIEKGVIPTIKDQNNSELSELVDGLIIPGDLVPTGGIYQDWENYFFNPSDSLTTATPIYPVPGNHEYFLNGLSNFIKYFNLPTNGTPGNLEEWWYKDVSNTRIIGLNSNSGGGDQDVQLIWLQSVLDDACNDPTVDFVFAQVHHPYKSELWIPGELDFTGEIIELLENFTEACTKPSIHFFGHTHAYSRGQSKDHKHLWVNVATAGGNIDYWGEHANADYAEFVKSEDEYGFVVVDVEAGANPEFTLKRYSTGDESTTLNNELHDQISIRRYEQQPSKPVGLFPSNEAVNGACLLLKANRFADPTNDSHQAAQWQIADLDTDFENNIVYDSWKQSENWYNEVNLQAGDDLTDERVEITLGPNQLYYWRVRYRDEHLEWSPWSDIETFTTLDNSTIDITGNLILNPDAEAGTNNWSGDIESVVSNGCGTVPSYAGSRHFAVGGVCSGWTSFGTATQDISVGGYSTQIDLGEVAIKLSGYLRDYNGNDVPIIHAEFYDLNNNLLGNSPSISMPVGSWTYVEQTEPLPIGTTLIRIVLEGDRNAGFDNDSYFDDLALVLQQEVSCSQYVPEYIQPQVCLWLEGAYDPVLGTMPVTLLQKNLLPDGQPYDQPPWDYPGTEGQGWSSNDYPPNAVDWVKVGFQTDTTVESTVAVTSALVQSHGCLFFPNTAALVAESDSSLYITVEHRNHLGIRSPMSVPVVGLTLSYDFRIADSYHALIGSGQKELSPGVWGMFAGDGNQLIDPDGYDINLGDRVYWAPNNGLFDIYIPADYNLDGDINAADKVLWDANNGVFSTLRK